MNRGRQTRRRGRLIIFEGPDGSGKTTASKELVEILRGKGKRTEWFAFPGHEPGTLGGHVYALHHDEKLSKMHPLSRQFLHIAAHIDQIERRILPALRNGVWVVLDRFWWSTWVYGAAEGADLAALRWGIAAERCCWAGREPDIAFLFRREASVTDAKKEFHARLNTLYHALARKERRRHQIRIIENRGTLSELVAAVSAATFEPSK